MKHSLGNPQLMFAPAYAALRPPPFHSHFSHFFCRWVASALSHTPAITHHHLRFSGPSSQPRSQLRSVFGLVMSWVNIFCNTYWLLTKDGAACYT